MADRLALYNAALREIGQSRLASLTEAREPRYLLDDVWLSEVHLCLEAGQWNFAMRPVEISPEGSVTPLFGFHYAFAKPDDWMRTCAVSANEDFSAPLMRYEDETDYWHADVDPLYVRYVSKDEAYGMDLARWPATFSRFVELALALRICPRTTESDTRYDRIRKDMERAKTNALSKDAMNEPSRYPAMGTWANARFGGWNGRWR